MPPAPERRLRRFAANTRRRRARVAALAAAVRNHRRRRRCCRRHGVHVPDARRLCGPGAGGARVPGDHHRRDGASTHRGRGGERLPGALVEAEAAPRRARCCAGGREWPAASGRPVRPPTRARAFRPSARSAAATPPRQLGAHREPAPPVSPPRARAHAAATVATAISPLQVVGFVAGYLWQDFRLTFLVRVCVHACERARARLSAGEGVCSARVCARDASCGACACVRACVHGAAAPTRLCRHGSRTRVGEARYYCSSSHPSGGAMRRK